MSRVGKQPIMIPAGVTVRLEVNTLVVTGPRGELRQALHPAVRVSEQDGMLSVAVANPEAAAERALWGLFRNLIRNMVEGVTRGFNQSLELVGVGYKASVTGQTLNLHVGFSHPLAVALPPGISANVEKNVVTIAGNDKQLVGEVAASIRRLRKPEPYKGKGIKYRDEVIRRKAGKAVKAVGK